MQLIAKTEFLAPPDVPWSTDAIGGKPSPSSPAGPVTRAGRNRTRRPRPTPPTSGTSSTSAIFPYSSMRASRFTSPGFRAPAPTS
ncbi:thymidylate synthase thyX domain protein [Mycobacterium xenopi 4042]|uniref:Thymidylate synthase thyX domain protein n=1 Tax=Mycobacterium xenopi 4042 TaxID=1299334 RepID=X8CG54_MYCXE|nr:thymidylate synthase thyX domain protein [Mycobacterium xenopi 4042]